MRTNPALSPPAATVCLGLSLLLTTVSLVGRSPAADLVGPKNATVLLIRHAEKPAEGTGLTPAGETRAQAYIKYFQELTIESQPATPARLIATADSKGSQRPRLTLRPLGKALGLPVETTFKSKDYLAMVASLPLGASDGKTTLICWHHGEIPDLLKALGADVDTVLPGGKWPEDEYDWLIELRYDAEGHLHSAQRVEEHLTAAATPAPTAAP